MTGVQTCALPICFPVTIGTGANIVENALNGPKAKEAADRFEASLEGQLSRLTTGVSELFRDISSGIFEALPVKDVIAGMRGGVEAVREIVKEIVDLFMPIIDPSKGGDKLKSVFETVRDITFDIAEKFAEIGNKLHDQFSFIVNQITFAIEKASAIMEGGVSGWATGWTEDRIDEAEKRLDRKEFERNMSFLDREKATKDFFEKAKTRTTAGGSPAEGVAEAAKTAAKKIDEMTKSAEQFNLSMRDSVLYPMEKFNDTLAKITIQQNQFLKLQDGELKTNNMNILNRQKANSIADFIGQNSIGTSYLADRATRGSKEEWDTAMRQRFGDQGVSLQERIARALDQSAQIEREQADLQKELLKAWERVPKPAGVGFMPKGI